MSITKLVLDYSKWRCGLNGETKVGEGETRLKNAEGFMCCIGQWCEQVGVPETQLLDITTPTYFKYVVQPFNQRDGSGFVSSRFSIQAMQINDNKITTPEEKIIALKELCHSYDIELEVINKPEINLQD